MHVLSHPIMQDTEEIINCTERAVVFLDETYLKIVEEMFTYFDGAKTRKNTAFLKALRMALSDIEYPTFDDVWRCTQKKYSTATKKQNTMWIRKAGWVNDNRFGEQFISEYVRRWRILHADKAEAKKDKAEADMRHRYTIKKVFDYDNTMDVLRRNRYVQYDFPEHGVWRPEAIDYDNLTTLQIITLHHVGGNPRVPIPLLYHYACNCGNEIDLPYEVKEIICDAEDCGGKLKRSPRHDTFKSGYASQVVTSDFNNISIISLVEIPSGEFNAAVFVQKNKAGYYLFMIAVEEIAIESPNLDLTDDEHIIWQLIRRIDQSHEKAVKQIQGMEWYKASIVLGYLANYQRHTSLNTLILGEGGSGKTSIARFYMSTLTPQMKMQDAISLSEPGLYGSTTTIKISDTTIMIPEAGLLSRYKLVGIDEVYEKLRILPVLRSLLRVANIAKEVAGNRTSMPKNATVIGTSNILPSVVLEQSRWELQWIHTNDEDPSNEWAQQAAHEAMIMEWTARGLDWHTGQAFPDMDRWTFIFLIEDPAKKLELYHLDASDMKIDDLTLSRKIYDHSIDNYLLFCSKIQVDWKKDGDRILEFVKELQQHDKIHSKRMAQDITMVLTLSAQINGRSELTDEDFDFVRELWSKTCEWIDVSELSHNSDAKTHPVAEWTVERIKKEIHKRMKAFEGSQKYWMTARGFSLIAAELEDTGADAGLVDVVIEKYRQSPCQ